MMGGGNTDNTASEKETSICDKNQEGLEDEKQNDVADDCNTVLPLEETVTDLSKDFVSTSADLRRNGVDETSENKRHFDGERTSMSSTLEKTTKECNSEEITVFKASSGGNATLSLMEEEECRSYLSGNVVMKDVGYISTLTVDDNDDEGKNSVNIHSKEATTLSSIVNAPLSTGILLTQPVDGDNTAENHDEYLHDNGHNGVHDEIVSNDDEQDKKGQNEQVHKGSIQITDANNSIDNKVESDMDLHDESNLALSYRSKEEKNKNEIKADKSHINASNNSIVTGDNGVILTQVYSMPFVADKVVASTHGMVLSSSEEEDSSCTCDQDEMGDEDNREGTPPMDGTDNVIGFEEDYESDQGETNSSSQNGGLQQDAKTPIDKVTTPQKDESPFSDEKTLGPNKEIKVNDSTFNKHEKKGENVQDVIADLKNNSHESNTTFDPYEEETQPLPPHVTGSECSKTETKTKCIPDESRKNVNDSIYAKDTAKCAMSNSYTANTEQESSMDPCSKDENAIASYDDDDDDVTTIDADDDDDETTIDAEQEENNLKNNEYEGKRIGNASFEQRQIAQLPTPRAAHTDNHSKIYLLPNKFSQFSSNSIDSKSSSMSSGLRINDDPTEYDRETASNPETVSALASTACKRSTSVSEAFTVCVGSALERDVNVSRIELNSEELAKANAFAATPIRTKGIECNEKIPMTREVGVGSNDESKKTANSPEHFTPDNIVEWIEAKHSQFNQLLSDKKQDDSPKDKLNRNISSPCYDNKKEEGEDKATKCQSHPRAAQSINLQSTTSDVVVSSSRKRKRGETTKTSFCIIFTGIEMTARYKKMIECLGGTILDDIASASQATHVVAGDGKASLRRTPKLMICMCCTPNIVDVKWLVQSAKEKRVLECSDYLLLDKVAEEKYNFSMKNTIQNGCIVREARGGLLGDWYIYFCKGVAGNKAPPPEELKLIVKAANGRMLTSINAKAIKDIDSTKIIIITSDPPLPLQRNRQIAKLCEKGAKVFNTSWLFHSIVNQHLSEIDNTSKVSSSLNAKVELAPFSSKKRRASTRLKS